jgi:hypothetical protein
MPAHGVASTFPALSVTEQNAPQQLIAPLQKIQL